MRRPLALFALLVTTWSNAAVLRCYAMAPVSEGSQSSAEHHAHAHAGHGAQTPDTSDETGDASPQGSPHTQQCGLVMACGTALNGTGAKLDHELLGPLGDVLHAAATAPTSVDLAQEPPPPRRLA